MAYLPNKQEKRIYLCLRTHQTWIENTLEKIGAKKAEPQALMVKHLAQPIKERKSIPIRGEKVWANPAATIRVEQDK